jgi:hypothetical protein
MGWKLVLGAPHWTLGTVTNWRSSNWLLYVMCNSNKAFTRNLEIRAFWDTAPCSLGKIVRRLRRESWLLHKGDSPMKRRSTSRKLHGSISQRAATFILAAVRTWNLTFPNLSTLLHSEHLGQTVLAVDGLFCCHGNAALWPVNWNLFD